MKRVITSLVGACAMLFALALPAQTTAPATPVLPTNVYAAGGTYNSAGSPSGALTLMYAHAISAAAPAPTLYAFTVVDVLQQSVKPFTVNTNVGVGVATKVATIGNFPIYVPTSAGISLSSQNLGWNYSGGGATFIHLKGNYSLMPSLRFSKSSVSGGSGYQLMPGIAFVFGQ